MKQTYLNKLEFNRIQEILETREFDTSHKKTQRNVLKLRYFFIFFAFFSCVSLRVMVYCM